MMIIETLKVRMRAILQERKKKRGGLNHLWINTHVLFEEFSANLERNEEEKGTKAVNKQLWQCYMYELHNEIDDCVNERGCV